jgi:stress response protein YsnF
MTMTTRDTPPDHIAIPVVEETVVVEKHARDGDTVRLQTVVHEEEVVVDEPLLVDEVEVARIPCDRWVDGAQAVRQEGDTTIIPVVKEVATVVKRLRLIEEVRITRRQASRSEPQRVTVRRQEALVHRQPAPDRPAGGD